MKRYDEYLHKELIILEEKDIERLIDLEIAHEGVVPCACPEVPSLEKEGIVCSDVGYKIGNFVFRQEEDALKVSQMETLEEKYDWGIGYDYKYLDPITDTTVSKVLFYKQQDVMMIKEVLQRNKLKKDEYDKKKITYDSYLSKTGKIRGNVYSFVREAKDAEEEFELARKTYQHHLKLADGDATVAVKFFKNTYKDNENIIDAVLGKQTKEENK